MAVDQVVPFSSVRVRIISTGSMVRVRPACSATTTDAPLRTALPLDTTVSMGMSSPFSVAGMSCTGISAAFMEKAGAYQNSSAAPMTTTSVRSVQRIGWEP